MKESTANNLTISLYFSAAYLSANMLDTTFWHVMSIAFLIAGAYGIVCQFKKVKFLF